jgi:peroxiredoxin
MAQFEPHKNELEQGGVQLVFIAAQKRNGMWKPAKFLVKHPISFPFLLDEDRSVTKAYGLYNRLGRDAINIARTATLVIDRQGKIRYLYRGDDQADRAPMGQVMEAVRKIAG